MERWIPGGRERNVRSQEIVSDGGDVVVEAIARVVEDVVTVVDQPAGNLILTDYGSLSSSLDIGV